MAMSPGAACCQALPACPIPALQGSTWRFWGVTNGKGAGNGCLQASKAIKHLLGWTPSSVFSRLKS